MIIEKNEIKLANSCGMEVAIRYEPIANQKGIDRKGKVIFMGTIEQWREFDRLLGVLEEQFETEAEIIRENNKSNQ